MNAANQDGRAKHKCELCRPREDVEKEAVQKAVDQRLEDIGGGWFLEQFVIDAVKQHGWANCKCE
eukprot:359072-Karenia_brevis.AAC.1